MRCFIQLFSKHLIHDFVYFVGVKRFGDVAGHSRPGGFGNVFDEGVGSQGDDGDSGSVNAGRLRKERD